MSEIRKKQKEEKTVQTLLRMSRLPLREPKIFRNFNFSQVQGKEAEMLQNLSTLAALHGRRNLAFIGPQGVGKTHLAIGIGLKACSLGLNVLFKNAATLSTELAEARDNYTLGKLEKRIQQADLLILDELSYISFNRHQSELLFKVVSERSERGSVIVTTNLSFSKWTDLFENTTMVAALVDRLTFKSYVLDMNGESFRLEQTMKSY